MIKVTLTIEENGETLSRDYAVEDVYEMADLNYQAGEMYDYLKNFKEFDL